MSKKTAKISKSSLDLSLAISHANKEIKLTNAQGFTFITSQYYIKKLIKKFYMKGKNMKIGFTIGKFAPLHKGHQYLIEKGIKEMDEFYVVIYETNVIKIPIEERAKWIKDIYPNVKILYAKNPPSQYGLDEKSVKIQTDYLKTIIKKIPVTHFYSSELYGKFVARDLQIEEIEVDRLRKKYSISATQIRNNMEENKKYLENDIYKELIKNS